MGHIFSDVLKILITKFSYQFASRNMILYIIKTVLGVAQSSLFLTLFPMCLCWCLVIRFYNPLQASSLLFCYSIFIFLLYYLQGKTNKS